MTIHIKLLNSEEATGQIMTNKELDAAKLLDAIIRLVPGDDWEHPRVHETIQSDWLRKLHDGQWRRPFDDEGRAVVFTELWKRPPYIYFASDNTPNPIIAPIDEPKWAPLYFLDVLAENMVTPGYHLDVIPQGKLGELNKVAEELAEAVDAEKQGCKIMLLNELADIVGAVAAVAAKHGVTLDDLVSMVKVTERAFTSGQRTSKEK